MRTIALYLPQFHPIPENDEWWGKGFTEWTNVGKAKPLFPGHNQPRVPADLGYYDLRVEETRIAQAEMAKEYGIDGFCYWHYWFGNGKQLLERPFQEVLKSGKPDFPFCLGWANHTWKAKTWSPNGKDIILIEQKYGGIKDYTEHFNKILPAFLDERYIKVNNKPFFLIWDPFDMPNVSEFIELWNDLAIKNGLEGIHFVASATNIEDIDTFKSFGFNAVSLDLLLKSFQNRNLIRKSCFRVLRALFKVPKFMSYKEYTEYFIKNFPAIRNIYPSLIPNFDHSPRSGKYANVLIKDSPEKFGELVSKILNKIDRNNDNNILIIRSWNEWAEGNYLEPDLKYGKRFLEVLSNELEKYRSVKKK
jgi:hypothetical protein